MADFRFLYKPLLLLFHCLTVFYASIAQTNIDVFYVENSAQFKAALGSNRTIFIKTDTLKITDSFVLDKIHQLSIMAINEEPAVIWLEKTCKPAFIIKNSSTIDFENIQIEYAANPFCKTYAIEIIASIDVLLNNCILMAQSGSALKATEVFGLTVSQTTITESFEEICLLEHTTNTLFNLCSFINNGYESRMGRIELKGCNMISFKNCFFASNFSNSNLLQYANNQINNNMECNNLELDRCTFESNEAQNLTNLPPKNIIITENYFNENSFDTP